MTPSEEKEQAELQLEVQVTQLKQVLLGLKSNLKLDELKSLKDYSSKLLKDAEEELKGVNKDNGVR